MTKYASLLVTGGAGFIGSNFIRFVMSERPDITVVNLDALTYSGNLENLKEVETSPRYRFVHGDINDRELVESLLPQVEAVVNFAAESHVDRSILDARPFLTSNIVGTQTLLDAVRSCRDRGEAKRFLQVSTDEVYGYLPLERPDLKFTESTPLTPSSPYAASKASADLLVQAAHETFGLDTVMTRCSNNFGPYQFPEKVIPLFVSNLLEGKKVPLYGDGKNVRDWLHVFDHCEAILTVLERAPSGEVYNVGGDNERSNLELTQSILDLMNVGASRIEYVKDRPGHDLRYAIDAGKIERELGWRPSRSAWPEALAQTIQWYADNETWWRNVKSGAYREYYQRQYGPEVA